MRLLFLVLVAGGLVAFLGAGCEPSAAASSAPSPATTSGEASTPPEPSRVPSDSLPDGFVYLREVAPTILQEMRYATAYNFVGSRIDGYDAPECILTTQAARALAAVQADLEPQHLSLKVYDCYRPQRAVNHFVRWAQNGDEAMKQAFYPEEPKRELFRRGYIARQSGHSRGSTMDLTLVPLPYVPPGPYPERTDGPLPRCDRPITGATGPDIQGGGRFPEGDLDMGTAYDCLSPGAATESRAVGPTARRNRHQLREAMSRHGFRNYSKEWWHYTLRNEPFPRTYYDFPVR